MYLVEIGCCGAYCKTCRAFLEKVCNGCKSGYITGERDIRKAKCKIKVCCVKRTLDSCADCGEYLLCNTIQDFHGKAAYKYNKYKEAIEYIRNNGYEKFTEVADNWKNAYGRYK